MTARRREIELLAPARDAQVAIEAIKHGADAVYMGATRFGARVAAANAVPDVARVCDFAHAYGARVYATVNTIILRYPHARESAFPRGVGLLAAGGGTRVDTGRNTIHP